MNNNQPHESEAHLRSLVDHMLNGFAYCRMHFENGQPRDFTYIDVNPAFEKLTGLRDVIGKRVSEVIPGILESNPELFETYGRVISSGKPEKFETYVTGLDSWFSVSVYCPEAEYFVTTFDNITDRKQAEDRLKLFRTLLDNAGDAIEVLDPFTLRFIDMNDTECRDLGYSREELLSMSIPDIVGPNFSQDKHTTIEEQIRQSGRARFEAVHRRKDGSTFPVEVNSKFIELDKPYLLSIARDISERKLHEIQLNRIYTLVLAIRRINEHLLVTKNEKELFDFICTTLKGLDMIDEIWIGLGKAGTEVTPVSGAGVDQEYLQSLPTRWDETGNGHGPMRTAIQEKKAIIYNDAPNDKRLAWCHEIENLHIKSGACFPLASDGEVIGALAIWSEKPAAFDEETVKFLIEVAGDIAMGLRSLRMEKKLEATLVSFEKSLEGTIRAIANIVELRDPYTAGHERRVSQLAMAIGRELGLPERQVEGLRVAGFIHDLGKIAIPAEILSKPTRLTETEYSLIRTHSQAGFDILKELDFPWPIAQTVLQHHERLDGSGYPRGLKGDEILVEARILAVADVVEAMSSHRPYRAGLGIDAALEEISRNRGVFYCAKAVETCIKLFREQGYQLSA